MTPQLADWQIEQAAWNWDKVEVREYKGLKVALRNCEGCGQRVVRVLKATALDGSNGGRGRAEWSRKYEMNKAANDMIRDHECGVMRDRRQFYSLRHSAYDRRLYARHCRAAGGVAAAGFFSDYTPQTNHDREMEDARHDDYYNFCTDEYDTNPHLNHTYVELERSRQIAERYFNLGWLHVLGDHFGM